MGYLLDTNVLNAPESPVMRRLRQHRPGDVAVSAFVIHELFYSIRHSASSATSGTPIGPYDILIAGQALARGLILVTHNTGEFSRLPGLRTEDWQA